MDEIPLNLRPGTWRWLFAGVPRGFAAGIPFIAFEVVASGLTGAGYAWPLRLIAGILLGWSTLPPDPLFSLGVIVFVALVVNSLVSSAFGALFSVLIYNAGVLIPRLGSRMALVGAGMAFGFVLWGVDIYALAIFFDAFPWFEKSNPLLQAIAHTFFYGGVLGLLVGNPAKKGADRDGG